MLAFSIKEVFTPAQIPGYGDTTGVAKLATDIITVLTGLALILCVFFIITSGIKITTAGGDPKKLGSATSTLTYAIIGLVVTILAMMILRLVQFFFKSNIPI